LAFVFANTNTGMYRVALGWRSEGRIRDLHHAVAAGGFRKFAFWGTRTCTLNML